MPATRAAERGDARSEPFRHLACFGPSIRPCAIGTSAAGHDRERMRAVSLPEPVQNLDEVRMVAAIRFDVFRNAVSIDDDHERLRGHSISSPLPRRLS